MIKIILYLILIKILCTCYKENSIKSTISLPSFRKHVEEVSLEKPVLTTPDDETNKLVSFLVKNIREIFGEFEETSVHFKPTEPSDETTIAVRKTLATLAADKEEGKFNIQIDEKDLSYDTKTDEKDRSFSMVINEKSFNENVINSTKIINNRLTLTTNSTLKPSQTFRVVTENAEMLNLTKELILLQKEEKVEGENQALESIDPLILNNSMLEREHSSIGRSCIFCNNVALMECYDPKNKLIPSNLCEREEDLCYSQHTPFGIVDRGCFNVNHNLSTYVCSCNLCNYISISEMPYIFSTKRDWVENVMELSRTRRLKRSVLKEMSCLRCEVNSSIETVDILDNTNCLEGNVGTLAIQDCSENEICGVKAIRSEGYIWRGCVTQPLYNYWWTLCDSDLCNYDSLVSIYDEL